MDLVLNSNKFAYITLLSSLDYLKAVLVLNESLKHTNSKYPLICAVTNDLKTQKLIEIFNSANIKVEWIERLKYSDLTCDKNQQRTVLNTASKISIFKLTNYDKLCYIDADTIVMKNIDDVFEYLDGSMIYESNNYGFTGLFVFIPANHRYDFYLHLMKNFDCFDGDLIGSLWFHTITSPNHQIPQSYCAFYNSDISSKNLVEVKVWHFCNPDNKPWIIENRKNMGDNAVLAKYDLFLEHIERYYF